MGQQAGTYGGCSVHLSGSLNREVRQVRQCDRELGDQEPKLAADEVRIGGTLIWYYYICPRQVWLMSRGLYPAREHELLQLGKLIDQRSYENERKQVEFGDCKIDILRREEGAVVIGEVKKSSRASHAARMQLAYYLYQLEMVGVEAKGELLYPKERRRERVSLDEDVRAELEQAVKEITSIVTNSRIPDRKRIRYCRSCAYGDWCWS